ncbi:MAG: polyprenyl synthetase family protein [Gemmatimonadota bacterium]|nr:polyprenyl synthetase family protein [Gemmatimonadota bacterium]
MLEVQSDWRSSFAKLREPVSPDLERIRALAGELVLGDFCLVDKPVGHLLSTSGKMIRPMLMLLCAGDSGVDREHLISMGVTIELIHTASLVHDDSIDRSAFRRGVPTLNAKWDHKTSVIIGDYLLSQAFCELARPGVPELISVMTLACRDLALGEMRQMAMEGNLQATEEDYFAFIRGKTASLFSAAASVASVLNGAANRELLSHYGVLFGSIYQITDDLLDYVGSSPETGKPRVIDILEHKMTLPLIHAIGRMSPGARAEVEDVFSRQEIDRAEAEHVALLVEQAGGIEYARARVKALADEAIRLLEKLPERDLAEKLATFVEVIVERDR